MRYGENAEEAHGDWLWCRNMVKNNTTRDYITQDDWRPKRLGLDTWRCSHIPWVTFSKHINTTDSCHYQRTIEQRANEHYLIKEAIAMVEDPKELGLWMTWMPKEWALDGNSRWSGWKRRASLKKKKTDHGPTLNRNGANVMNLWINRNSGVGSVSGGVND